MINYLTCSHWNNLSWKCEMKGWLGKGKKSMKGKREGDCTCYESWCFCIPPTNFPTYLINVNCQYMTIHRQGAFPSMGETSWPSKAYASKTSFLRCLLTTLVVSYLYKRQYSLQLKANLWIEAATKSERQKGFLWQESLTSSGSWQTASQRASESCESSQRVMRVKPASHASHHVSHAKQMLVPSLAWSRSGNNKTV